MRTALALAAAGLTAAACATAPAPEVARFDGARVMVRSVPAEPSARTRAAAARLCAGAGKVAEYAWTRPAPAAGHDHLFLCF